MVNERRSKKARPTVVAQHSVGLFDKGDSATCTTFGVAVEGFSSSNSSINEYIPSSFQINPWPFPISEQMLSHRIIALNNLGIQSFDKRDWENAAASFADAIKIIEPGEPYFVHGRIHRDTQGLHAAIETLQKHQSSSSPSLQSKPSSSSKTRMVSIATDSVTATTINLISIDNVNQILNALTHSTCGEKGVTLQDSNHHTEYDEGMDCFQRPESFDFLTKDDMLTSLYYNLGLVRLKEGNTQAATTAFLQAHSKAIVIDERSTSSLSKAYKLFRLLHKIAYVQYSTKNHVDAILYYHRALTMAMNSSLDATMIAATLNCIAVINFHRNTQDSARTMELLKQSLNIFRECVGKSPTKEVATVLNNMGRVYFLQFEYQEAFKVYKEALAIREVVLGKESIDVAATIYNTAQVHLQLGQKDLSLKLYLRFLSVMRAFVRNRSGNNLAYAERDIAIGCRCVANIYQDRGETKLAIQFLQDALQSTKKVFGLFHGEVASILNKLGNLHYEVRDYATALTHYRDGLAVENAILSPDHPHIIVTLTNIAHILKQQHDYPGAVLVYKKVLRKQRKTLGESSLDVAATLSSLGLAQYHDGLYEDAFECYQDALRIRREHFESDDHLDIASTLNSIGLVLFKQRSLSLAQSCFDASLKIRTKLLGKDHRDVAVLWYNLATIHFEMGQDDTAIRMYQETLRVEKAALGADHADVVLTLQHLGQIHQQLGKLDEALDYFSQALSIERRKADERECDKFAVARVLNLIGNIYIQQGDIDMMMESFVEAARILESRTGSPERNELLLIHGYNHYGLSKLHPPCAPVA